MIWFNFFLKMIFKEKRHSKCIYYWNGIKRVGKVFLYSISTFQIQNKINYSNCIDFFRFVILYKFKENFFIINHFRSKTHIHFNNNLDFTNIIPTNKKKTCYLLSLSFTKIIKLFSIFYKLWRLFDKKIN